ncbi:MAG: efflux RND transporter permease subunit [Anaerolineaceae bacterium]|nr:efflux RND transporter permease subunit [Anaerolineaceae bacterium]
MKSLFSFVTNLSLRFRAVTLALVVTFLALGMIAVTQLRQELIPSIEFPTTVILAQASGMTSEQVLTVLTEPLENALSQIPEVVNLETQTTGSFGTVIQARNDFGLNQAKLRVQIQDAVDGVWLPLRHIQAPEGETTQAFVNRLLGELTPDMLLYLQRQDSNFLFQLTPEVWNALPDDTVRTLLIYLAGQTEDSASQKGALQQLIDQEIVPQLESLDIVARVSISGGQALPTDGDGLAAVAEPTTTEATSLLLQLSPDVWTVVAPKVGLDTLDNSTVMALSAETVALPTTIPALPPSWQMDHFENARDLWEMRTLTRNIAAVFNQFYTAGRIVGALGQTNDLTPETVTQMLALDPSMVNYFEAEQLAAMPADVFAVLPEDFIANLDGFTRDELTAKALAQSITGEEAEPTPVDLPQPWRISPPQLITFSFDDLPLASYSVFVSGDGLTQQAASGNIAENTNTDTATNTTPENTPTDTTTNNPGNTEIPEGPPLPPFFLLMGSQFGVTLDTADDLINLQLPESAAQQFGASTLQAADLFNFLTLLRDPSSLPPGTLSLPFQIDVKALLQSMGPDVIVFLADNDPTFIPNLSPAVFDMLSDAQLALPQAAPPLGDVWNALASQPQFTDKPLKNAADLLAIGNGQASSVLNTINTDVPEQFAGYEVRLFDSLSTGVVRYLTLQEPGFFSNLDTDVLVKLSPQVLNLLPQDVIDGLDTTTAATVAAIASGEQDSAVQELAALYTTNVAPADPNAPALTAVWQEVGNFLGIELDTADDLFRFPDKTGIPSQFMNGFFNSAAGRNYAPRLLGGLSYEAIQYISADGREPDFLDKLSVEALQLLTPDVLAQLPEAVQARAQSNGEEFTPTAAVTRANGNPSLVLTVYKVSGANTVEAFHQVDDVINEINATNSNIDVSVAFQQASFIEESIAGVAREGGLGGFFAVIIILIFLSAGLWSRSGRSTTGIVLIALSAIALGAVVLSGSEAAGGDLGLAFAQADVIVRVLLILGIIAGALILLWPGRLPYPAWRSTLVVGISIPLSLAMAMAFMNWVPPLVHGWLAPAAETSSLLHFILRLFPESITINIMTLSGLTVAIGRVVDDSIVVLENIFREIQAGGDKRQAILQGTRDVSVAIFAATVITVVVFLPLGLTGGIISEFFLPFGLAVTYSLMSSFVVAITVVPVLAYMFIGQSEVAEEEHNGWLERAYIPVLQWALANRNNRLIVLGIALVSMIFGFALFGSRPTTFIPSLGEPQIQVSVSMPSGTKILETNGLVEGMETAIRDVIPASDLKIIQTTVGSSGASLESLVLGGGGVSENVANITVGIHSQDQLDEWTQELRTQAEAIFGKENAVVSAASLSDQGFGGFALVLSGPQDQLQAINDRVIETLNNVEGLANVTSSLESLGDTGSSNGPITYIRIDGESALQYTGELETENTLGVTQQAIEAIKAMPDLPNDVKVSQGFESELQTQGFGSLIVAMLIAMAIVFIILIITFGSLVHWFDIMLSIMVAPVGAAVALTLTNRVLGISAMIGMLMLIGIVVTNAVVLIDRVQANQRERKMATHDALIEAGGRRLRPIIMTALATIIALIPLAIGLSEGAIIASELGTVVIGGLFSSTLLTLIVVPVAYSLLHPLHKRLAGLFGMNGEAKA